MWTGVIGFGMVSIPVRLYTATDSKSSVSLHLIHEVCKTRIKEKRWCPACEREVAWEELDRGYEYSRGRYIAITDEEMEKLPVPSKNIVDVNAFVKSDEIDPIYFEKNYYIEPEKTAKRPFALFKHGLEDKSMVGIGRVTLRTRERLCVLRPSGDSLILSTLLYPDEIREDPAGKIDAKVTRQELNMAYNLIELLSQEFEPEKYKDEYKDALKELVEAKLEGVPLEELPEPVGGEVVDLMEALKASVSRARQGKAATVKAGGKSGRQVEEKAEAAPGRSKRPTARKKKRASASRTGAAGKRTKRGAA